MAVLEETLCVLERVSLRFHDNRLRWRLRTGAVLARHRV